MVRKLVTLLTAGLLVFTPFAAHALGFGAIKLNSALNERFDAEVEILSPTPEDIKSLKVKLASPAAFLRAGVERSNLSNSLLFNVTERPNNTYYIHLTSKLSIREPFLNFLVEMSWKNGRMLREYTVLLDPPSQLSSQQTAQAPAVIETPATAEPAAVKEAEATTPVTEPFVPAPVIAAPAVKEEGGFELADGEQLPRIGLSTYKETDADVKTQQETATQDIPKLKHEPVVAEPEAAPVMAEKEPAKLPEPTSGDMVADSKPFADDELFPTIPLSAYREDSAAPEMGGDLDYGITTKNDNLWNIASKMRPSEDVSIYQVMMALVQANPDAFVEGNIHRLKVGHVLRIDDPSLLTAMSKQQAANEYQLQTRQWDEFRQAAAGSVEQQPVIATQVESETAVAEPASKGELTLATPESTDLKAGTGVSEDAISNDLATLKAELAQMRDQASAAHGQNETLNSRIRELENQLADMQRTISIKDDELAALQKQLSDTNQQPVAEAEPTPAAVVEPPKAEPESVVETPVAEAQPEMAAEKAATEMVEETKPVVEQEAVTETPVQIAERIAREEKAKPVPVKKPAPAKEEGIMDTVMGILGEAGTVVSNIGAAIGGVLGGGMTMYIVIAAAVLILFASLIVVKRRKQGENFQESILKGSPSSSPAGSDVPSADLATSEESSFLSDFAVSGAGAIQTEDSEVDPLTEADVFMAYGRYEAAEERLQEAIQSEPDRQELKLKLLELYNTTQNTTAFESTAEDIYASLGGDTVGNSTWDKVVALGKQLLPGNPLFSSDGTTVETDAIVTPQERGAELTDSQVMDIGLETGAFDTKDFNATDFATDTEASSSDDFDFNLDMGEPASADTAKAETSDDSSSMDFDLDLGESPAEDSSDDMSSMDFDLNLGETPAGTASDDASSLEFDLDLDESTPESASVETSSDDLSSMEFDLDLGESTAEVEDTGLDFNMDMDSAVSEDTSNALEETDSTMMMDIGEGLELDLDSGSSANSGAMDLGLDASDATDFDMPVEGDEVGTKLDLAKAYIDMGDPEGARSILDEVLDEGNDQQKAEAEQLMQQIA